MSRPTCRKLSTTQVISRTGLSPAMASLSKLFRYVLCYHLQALPISLALLSESRLMSFPRATEMFQFTRFASHDYVFIMRYLSVGFPIRKSPDQS